MNLKESELGETLSEKAFLLFAAISQDIYESFGLQYIADIQNNVCKNVWLKQRCRWIFKSGWASSDVVGIICPLVVIGLTELPIPGGPTLPTR